MINYSISWSSKPTSPKPEPADPLRQGIAAHQAGNLERAILHYAEALKARPNRVFASYNLGVALADSALWFAAIPHFRRALLLQPLNERFAATLIRGLLGLGLRDDAGRVISECRARAMPAEALRSWELLAADGPDRASDPVRPAALGDSAAEPADVAPVLPVESSALATLREPFARALQDYQAGGADKVIETLGPLVVEYPAWGEGHHLLGLAWMRKSQFSLAVESLRSASALLAGRVEIWDHLGVASVRAGDGAGALAAFDQAMALSPLRAETWNNAADAARSCERREAAYQYAQRAIQLNPDLVDPYRYLLQSAFELDEVKARDSLKSASSGILTSAIELAKAGAQRRPELANHIATQLIQLGREEDAKTLLEASLARHRDRAGLFLVNLTHCWRHLCDWQSLDETDAAIADLIRRSDRSFISPFAALAVQELTAADLKKVATQYCREKYGRWAALATELRPGPASSAHGRLKVGYLSSDFHEHATAYLTAALFEHHDRERFEFFAYSTGVDDDSPMRRRLEGSFEHFADLRNSSHLQAAQRIRDDGVQVLVDLKGHTTNNRLEVMALRPSPVQATWLGFPGGVGAPFIDYLIADPLVLPPAEASHYVETLAYLPDAYAPVDPRRAVAKTPSRADVGLPERGFVFCSFNAPYKMTPKIFDRWCRLLKAAPDSVLWLFAAKPSVIENLRREAAARGVSPGRLVFADALPQPEHLARIALADLFLDTLPINAHTTASDLLWMGVPVLTCVGQTFASRVAASLVTAAGLPELVTASLDEYEAKALQLALNPAECEDLKRRLTASRSASAYFDAARFARHLEGLYERMWARHAAGLPPVLLEPRLFGSTPVRG